jgi:hypothetical protein
MSLRDDAKKISQVYEALKSTLNTNFELLDIYEGNLLPYVLRDLKCQLGERAYKTASRRVPPINLMKRLVDKLSTIYSIPPKREVEGTDTDRELWDWYIDNFDLNVEMQIANEYFNMHKSCALEPYLDSVDFKPRLRPIPYDRFFVCGDDQSNPLRPTHFTKLMGKSLVTYPNNETDMLMILYVYTDNEFLIIDERGDVRDDMMRAMQVEPINPYGKIPFVYMNKSRTKVNPQADMDLAAMTTLIPILITDINYALMFQSFSMIITIDVDDENIQMNPNTVISLKSDAQSPHQPKVETIKPQVDSDKAFAAIQEQLALWLQSRNIRPGATGQVQADSMSSGISKMVDEMDTTNERKRTIPYFQSAEYDLFNLIKNHMHPVFILTASFEQRVPFTKEAVLSVEFSEQAVQRDRKDLLEEVQMELQNRLISQESAIRKMNPDWDDQKVLDEIARINAAFEVVVNENIEAEQTSAEETD